MPFFEPLPPPPPPREQAWGPPVWDRPSEGVVPGVLAVNALLHEGEDAAVAVDRLDVYPNGFTVSLLILFDPHRPREAAAQLHQAGRPMFMWPRVGVRFADGRTAGRSPGFGAAQHLRKDEHGIPLEPVVRMTGGGGGGSSGWRTSAWVFPLPPDGPLEIYVGLGTETPVEAGVTLDGSAVRAASGQAKVVWI